VGLAQLASDTEAVLAGQHNVQHQGVEILFVVEKKLQRFLAFVRDVKGMPFGFEVEAESLC